jgi:hypothetical protein
MHHSHFHRVHLAVLASALLVFGACSEAPRRDGGSAAVPAVSEPPLTESEAATLSSAGVGVVHHIVTARTQIERGRVENAWNELVQARALLENLLKESPAVRAKSRIWHVRERLRAEDTQALIEELAPIYDDLDQMEAALVPAAVRVHLDAAMVSLEHGEGSTAIDHLGAADASMVLTARDLPVARTYSLVYEALVSLSQEDSARAGRALDAAEEVVQLMVAAVATPEGATAIN